MSTSDRPLGTQISKTLKARGVDVIFGIPGVHNIELYRGIEDAGITHVLARHEQGAGFMADGFARATGRPGVAYVITGPGLCNIMTPMGQAYSDSVPMLVVSSCLERKDRSMSRGRLHEMKDQEGAAETVCDWSLTAPDADAAFSLIDRAFSEFETSRPRPKHIQVPIDVLGELASIAPDPAPVAAKPVASEAVVAEATTMLKSARRPLFIFGGGAKEGSAAAREVLEKSGAASFTTYAGKGIVSHTSPLCFGSYLSRPPSIDMIASADLVIAVGTQLSECDLWREHLGHSAPMVRVDIDPSCFSDAHRPDLPVLGDSAGFLSDLSNALTDHDHKSDWTADEVKVHQTACRATIESARPSIIPIIDAMAAVLPPETTFASDMTQFAYVAKEVYPINQPNRWHHPTGFGTLGYGLPAAIGAKIGLGDSPVVAIAGDYGFQYTLQELGVAVELGLSLPIILWDNGKLKEIEDCMTSAQIAPNAVVARNPDFCALARAFGANAVAPASLKELQSQLITALGAKGPTLIHVTPDIL